MYYLKDPETGLYFSAEINAWTSLKLTSTGYPSLVEAKRSRCEFDPDDFPLGIKIVKTNPVHNWRWATKQMRQGEAVRRKSWGNPDFRLIITKHGQVLEETSDHTNNWRWFESDLNATDWEVKND